MPSVSVNDAGSGSSALEATESYNDANPGFKPPKMKS